MVCDHRNGTNRSSSAICVELEGCEPAALIYIEVIENIYFPGGIFWGTSRRIGYTCKLAVSRIICLIVVKLISCAITSV